MDEMSISEISNISKIDSIKEDFAKVLTDWHEHIGYLQVSLILWFVKFIIFNDPICHSEFCFRLQTWMNIWIL